MVTFSHPFFRTECHMLCISSKTFQGILSKEENDDDNKLDFDIARMSRMRPFVKEVLSNTYLFQVTPAVPKFLISRIWNATKSIILPPF